MAESPNLVLPYIQASQAQKHVTHNEAIRLLDGMVQLAVLSRTLTSPPGSPADGDRYIVASGATGAWATWDLNVAFWIDGAWVRLVPRLGWIAYSVADSAHYAWNGSAWVAFVGGGGGSSFDDLAFQLTDNADATKVAKFQLSGITTGTTRTFTFPDTTSTLAVLAATQTFTGTTNFTGTFSVDAATGTLVSATGTATANVGSGATTSGTTKTVNLGTGGDSGSTTVVNIGSTVAGALGSLVINSPTVTFAASVSSIAMAAANLSALYVGIGGATADATNRLSINTPAVLFNHSGASLQATLNKNAAGNDAGFIFQTGFSTRALFGTLGSDDFVLKVSPDGSSFFDAFTVARATGRLTVANGLVLNPVAADLALPADGLLWYNSTTGKFRARQAGSTVDVIGGGGGVSDGDKGDVAVTGGGTAWTVQSADGDFDVGGYIQAVNLGVGTAASGTHVVNVAGASSNFSHDGAGHTINIGKISTGETASVSLKSAGSTRGEIGLIGSNNLALRTSPDGTAFATALTAAAADGAVTLHKPVLLEGQASDPGSPSNGTLWYDSTRGDLKARVDGATCVISRQDRVPFLVPPAGEYILTTAGLGGAAASTLAGAANRLEIFPWSPGADVSIDRLLINCTTAVAAAEVKIVVYSADENGRPDALLYETAALSVATTGQKFEAVALDFLKGRTYWLGIRHSSSAIVSAWAGTSTPDINGGTAISTSARKTLRRTLAFATAAPNPWGFVSSEIANGPATAIWMKEA